MVSVIIPVYNTKRYFPKCIYSIINQSYHNLEIILVDNGSTDFSGLLTDYYASRDKRIKTLHLSPNQGVAHARNEGIKLASGEHLIFADSDDWMELGGVQALLDAIKKYDSDLILGAYKRIGYKDTIPRKTDSPQQFEFSKSTDIRTFLNLNAWSVPWARIYRSDIINNNSIIFPLVSFGEDTLFNLRYMKYCKKAVLIPDVCYCYNRLNGTTTSTISRRHLDYIDSIKEEICLKIDLLYGDKKEKCKNDDFNSEFRYFLSFYARCCNNSDEFAKYVNDFIAFAKKLGIDCLSGVESNDIIVKMITDGDFAALFGFYNEAKENNTENRLKRYIKQNSIKLKRHLLFDFVRN